MASVRRQSLIAGRARRIGWPVETIDDGHLIYRITRPDGKRIGLTKSPSDVHWEHEVFRQLNGRAKYFDKAEAEWKTRHEAERQAKLAADKAAGDKKIADAAKQAQTREAAVVRAAGPHAVTEFDPAWLLTPHELPEIRRGILTPATAAKLLDTIDRSRENRHQRSYRQARERYFTQVIEAGEWAVTHQGMAIDTTGRMQDGQHRAGAIAVSNRPQEIVIAVGMPPHNYTAVDIPLARTARDALDISGETDVSKLASAIRLVMLHDQLGSDLYVRKGNTKITVNAIDAFMLDDSSGPAMRDAVHRCAEIRREIKVVASALTAALYLIRRDAGRGGDDTRISRFFEDLETGTHIERGDVVYKLRRIILNERSNRGRPNQYVALALIIKSWNARATGRIVKHLSWRTSEPFPGTIIVPAPEE